MCARVYTIQQLQKVLSIYPTVYWNKQIEPLLNFMTIRLDQMPGFSRAMSSRTTLTISSNPPYFQKVAIEMWAQHGQKKPGAPKIPPQLSQAIKTNLALDLFHYKLPFSRLTKANLLKDATTILK